MVDYLDILLGRGGQNPGVEAYSVVSGRWETILSLPVDQSVYAIDVSRDGKPRIRWADAFFGNWEKRHNRPCCPWATG